MANRPKLNRIWASTNTNLRRDPGEAKYVQGWVSEIPTYQVLNFLQNRIDTTILSIAERGIAEWGSDISYALNALAWDSLDGKVYISTVANPDKGKAPSTNAAQWSLSSVQVSRKEYDAVVSAITTHIADVTTNPHKLTAGDVGAYNRTETDGIIAAYYVAVRAHADNRNNPHNLQPEDIDAVSASRGGIYVGQVGFQKPLWVGSSDKVITSASGLFMQYNGYSLGLNAQGTPVAGPTNSTSPIVTDSRFEEVRAANEYAYATPMPVLSCAFQGDIHVQTGSCNLNYSWPTAYMSSYGSLDFSVWDGARSLVSVDFSGNSADVVAGGALGNSGTTVAIDVLAGPRTNGAQPAFGLGFGTIYSTIHIYNNGAVNVIAWRDDKSSYDAITGTVPYTPYTWVRLVAVFDRTTVSLYWNGTLIASGPATGSPGGPMSLFSNGTSDANQRRFYTVRNARIWNQSLTAKQVSNL